MTEHEAPPSEVTVYVDGGTLLRDVHVCPWPTVRGVAGAEFTVGAIWLCDCGKVWVLRQYPRNGIIVNGYERRWRRVEHPAGEWYRAQWLRLVRWFK